MSSTWRQRRAALTIPMPPARGRLSKAVETPPLGFEQSKTTHHFLLKPDGGVIQVQANDAQDTVSREQIRKHFHRIAEAFAAGDFQIPMMVHDIVPPGATTMKRLREKIQYTYEETPTGVRVVIKSADPNALDAIHDFLLYQIREHETGDPQAIS